MSWRHRAGHALLRMACLGSARRFSADLDRLEQVQQRKLRELLSVHVDGQSVHSPEAFRRQFSVSSYADWRAPVTEWQQGGRGLMTSPVTRFQPTSGSTSAIKWIPYTRLFLAELDAAIGPWLMDMYRQYPRLSHGSHYWSLSWLPTDMRDQHSNLNDDSRLLSFGKRLLAGMTQSVPDSVALAPSAELASFATLAWLAADRELSMISVWSPTFALTQQDQLFQWRHQLAEVLDCGHWGRYHGSLSQVPCPHSPGQAAMLRQWRDRHDPAQVSELWPRLSLISAWDTGAAAGWAQLLQHRLPMADFQGKGLWATEGVVTFPWQGNHVLAYQSHVYEFENLDNGELLWPWQLKEGMQVAPVLSTGSGLMRYRMGDCLRVGSFHGAVPTMTFLGREDGVDLVGEKLSTVAAQSVLDRVAANWPVRPVSLVGADQLPGQDKPGYVLLLEQDRGRAPLDRTRLAKDVDAWLAEHFHYRLARNLEQLAPLQVWVAPDMREYYLAQSRERGMIEGNIKVEPLRHWSGDIRPPDSSVVAPAEAMS